MPDQLQKVQIEASSREDAVHLLINKGYLVISVSEVGGEAAAGRAGFSFSFSGKEMSGGKPSRGLFSGLQRVSTRELIFFAIQLSTLLKAGVPLIRSLEIIIKGTKNEKFRDVLKQIAVKVNGGIAFSVALRQYPEVFPWVWINLVEVGESTGKLPQCLEETAAYQESSAKMQAKVITAFTYPAILTVVVIGALAFLMLFVVPKFADIFVQQKLTLPLITKIVLGVSNIARKQAYLFLVPVALAFGLGILAKKSDKVRTTFDMWSLSAPIFGPLMWQVAVVRFSRGFSTLLKSGVPILQALDIGGRLTENKFLEGKIKEVAQAVKGGQGLGVQLEARKVFPIFMTQLTAVGEETGQVDKFLDIIADFYEEQVDSVLARLSTLIEPVMLVVMGLIVGTIVISMFLPIVEISTGGGGK
jgi:type IV pilus assembly protein PilC